VIGLVAVVMILAATDPASAGGPPPQPPRGDPPEATTHIDRSRGPVAGDEGPWKVQAQALPNQCVKGIGNPWLPIGRNLTCPSGYKAKTTDTYMWAFTKDDTEQNLWWGTGNNAICGDYATVNPLAAAAGFGSVAPFISPDGTCEFDQADQLKDHPELGTTADSMPANIYQYNLKTKRLVERTPDDEAGTAVGGYRSAGSLNNVVFVAKVIQTPGAAGGAGGAVWLLAFRANDGKYLGALEMEQYNNPKVMFVVNHRLYLGMALATPETAPNGSPVYGHVLKWTGSVKDPFQFEVVGRLGQQPTYLQLFEGRLVAQSWPTGPLADQQPATLYISPRLGGDRELTSADQDQWAPVFNAGDFVPNHLQAVAMNGGGMQELGGWLYVGYMILPSASTFYHMATYPQLKPTPNTTLGWLNVYAKAENVGAPLIRIRNMGRPNQQVEILYGERFYNVYDPTTNTWVRTENKLHQQPLFGRGGFDNPFQYYSAWGSVKFRGKIYFGGFDAGHLAIDQIFNPDTDIVDSLLGTNTPDVLLRSLGKILFPDPSKGGVDVVAFSDVNSPATHVTRTGFNNAHNLGARDFFAVGAGNSPTPSLEGNNELYLGTQNGFNFPAPEGATNPLRRPGWQLIKMG